MPVTVNICSIKITCICVKICMVYNRSTCSYCYIFTIFRSLFYPLRTEFERLFVLFSLQQNLQASSVDSQLSFLHDSHLLEERGQIERERELLTQERSNFHQERKVFTEAAIRLGKQASWSGGKHLLHEIQLDVGMTASICIELYSLQSSALLNWCFITCMCFYIFCFRKI